MSQTVNLKVSCGSNYPIFEDESMPKVQFVASGEQGFTLSSYSSNVNECKVDRIQVSTTQDSVINSQGLILSADSTKVTTDLSDQVVEFYVLATVTEGGSE